MPNSRQTRTVGSFCAITEMRTQWDVAKGWDTTAGMSWDEERLMSTHLDSGAFPLLTLVYKGMILCTYMEGGRGKGSCLHIQLDQGQYIPRYPDVLQDFKRVSPDVWIYRKLLPDTVLVNFFRISKGWKRSATFTGKMLFTWCSILMPQLVSALLICTSWSQDDAAFISISSRSCGYSETSDWSFSSKLNRWK